MLKLNILILEGYILGAKILTEFGAMRPTVRPVGEMKKPKMTTKNGSKLANRPDHPRRRTGI